MNSSPSIWKAAAIGGSVAGFLSALPLVGALNCLCCSLIVGGGFLAAFMQSGACKRMGAPFGPGPGAMVGLACAPFYAIVSSLVGLLLRAIGLAPDPEQMMEQMRDGMADAPPEVAEMMEKFVGAAAGGSVLLSIVMGLVFGAIFCTIGGLIAGAVFKNQPAPPVASSPPPPPTASV